MLKNPMALAKAGSVTNSCNSGLYSCYRSSGSLKSEQDNELVWPFRFHTRLVHNVPQHIGTYYLGFLLDHQEM